MGTFLKNIFQKRERVDEINDSIVILLKIYFETKLDRNETGFMLNKTVSEKIASLVKEL